MGFQFVHIETYARRASTKQPNKKDGKQAKTRAVKLNARQVAQEADRQIGSTPHIDAPQPPRIIFGCRVSEVVDEAERRAEASRDGRDRKVREDTPVLLAGVASHHYPTSDLTDEDKKKDYEEWRKLTLDWLQEKYGGKLMSVVEHLDEEHPHIHFYAVPEAGKGFNAKSLHDGFAAGAEAKTPNEQKQLYTAAMKSLQDDFFEKVGARCGQARIGPRRQRLSRADWNRRKEEMQEIKSMFSRATAILAQKEREAKMVAAKVIAEARTAALRAAREISSQVAGGVAPAIERLKKEVDDWRRKYETEKKAKEEAQSALASKNLNDERVMKNLLTMKLAPVQKRLEIEQKKTADLTQQLDQLSEENSDLRRQLTPLQRRALTR